MIDCIVLAGGLGTRLRSVIPDRPKCLALIEDVPFLQILLQMLTRTKLVSKIVLAVGYRAEAVINFFAECPCTFPIEFSYEEQLLGTGGAVKQALAKTATEHVLVLNGDSYVDFFLEDLLAEHQRLNYLATLVYTQVENAARFGQVEIGDQEKKILGFKEKTGIQAPGLISAGVYIFRRTIFDSFSFSHHFSLEHDLFPLLVPKGIGAFYSCGSFIDIGTPDSYREAQTFFQPLVQKL